MEQDRILDSMASAKLGDANSQMAQPEQRRAQEEAGESASYESNESQAHEQAEGEEKTNLERATEVASPTDEMDKQAATFKVKFGDQERELTPEQISSTFQRYAALNHAHQTQFAPMKQVVALATAIQREAAKNGRNVSGDEIANLMAAATKAMIHNPQMGNGAKDATSETVDELSQWEEENAVSLPPKYKQALQEVDGLKGQMGKMMQALQLMSGKAQSVGQNAQQQLDTARDSHLNAIRASIGNNLARAQQQFGLPDEAENDFMQFAFSRGYTPEDFVDPRLTMAVVTDFKNNQNSPEMERLRALASKRQAFTGATQGAPSGGASTSPRGQDASFFNQMVDSALSKRFG